MPNSLNHLPINWVNGMKINKEHLIGQDNSLHAQLHNSLEAALNDVNFGLLPLHTHAGDDPYEVELSDDWVKVRRCQAILRSGIRVDIAENDRLETLQQPVSRLFEQSSVQSSEWFVILKTDPFKRQPFGEPDSEEFPVRHPYVIPFYQISIVPEEELNVAYFDRNAIPLAKILNYSHGRQLDRGYIPPCTTLRSCRALWEQYNKYVTLIGNIESDLLKIKEKTIEKNRSSGNQLSNDALELATRLLEFITLNKAAFRMLLPYAPPINMVALFSTMGGVFNDAIRNAKGKDAMLKYFQTWATTYSPSELQSLIEKAQNVVFNPLDMQESFKVIESFLVAYQKIFEKLKDLQFRDMWPMEGVIDNSRVQQSYNRQPNAPIIRQKDPRDKDDSNFRPFD